jgi:arylsulfatase A-like enzyme
LPPEQVAIFASWSRQRRAASSRDGLITVDAPEDQQPREPGPPWRNARWDTETFSRARAHWEAHHPRFLHLAFLDTDEYAHEGQRAEYEQALRELDARLQELLRWVAALPPDERRHTTVLLTADHGRGQSDWTSHGFFDRGSGDVFIGALGEQLQGRGEVDPDAEQRDVRPTIERLFGLCPPAGDDGRALEAIVGGLPCR